MRILCRASLVRPNLANITFLGISDFCVQSPLCRLLLVKAPSEDSPDWITLLLTTLKNGASSFDFRHDSETKMSDVVLLVRADRGLLGSRLFLFTARTLARVLPLISPEHVAFKQVLGT